MLPMNHAERIEDFLTLCPFPASYARELAEALNERGYFDAPASSKYHLAREGGLYEHSRNVYHNLKMLTLCLGLEWTRPESPFVIGFLHDLCKMPLYRVRDDGGYECVEKYFSEGHGDFSEKLCDELGIILTAEERLCIRYHMGAFTDRDKWGAYTGGVHADVNVLWTHTADMLAAHVDEVGQ